MRVDRSTRGTVQGRVAELRRRDRCRIAHPCPHEFVCTGCPLLAERDETELAFKRARVEAAAAAAGVDTRRIAPVLRSSGLFHYRHYAKQVFGRVGRRPLLGSYVAGTHEVVDNRGCPVLTPALADLLDEVAARAAGLDVHDAGRPGLRYAVARHSAANGDQLLVLVTSGDPTPALALARRLHRERDRLVSVAVVANRGRGNALLAGERVAQIGAPGIEEELLGFRHPVGPRSFFQINPAAASCLFAAALAGAGDGATCVEAYAGVGALTLPLAQRFGRVVAIEASAEALAVLAAAAAENVETLCARVEEALPGVLEAERPEVVVLDPPRRGIGARTAGVVAASCADRVVLLTCGLDALTSDLRGLAAGGFRVDAITPVDQFPRTGHVECVTVLSR